MAKSIKILVLSAGRRVAVLQALRNACQGYERTAELHILDINKFCACRPFADVYHEAKPYGEEYANQIAELAVKHDIDIILPLTHGDITCINRYRHILTHCDIVISGPATMSICNNKRKFGEFMQWNDLPYPVWDDGIYPVCVKPAESTGARGVNKANHASELAYYMSKIDNGIVQKWLEGQEYSVDCYVGRGGKVLAAVPRARLKVRQGEIEIGRTEHNEHIADAALAVVGKLTDAYGPLNVQGFDVDGKFIIHEFNARMGGGYPMTMMAGPDFLQALICEHLGVAVPDISQFRDMVMASYDERVITDDSQQT